MKNFYLFSVCLILFCQNVKGALIWTNGGSNNNWNTATNWEDDGTLENRVPLNSDTLVFNSVNVANCTLKTTAGTCGAMNITSAYTGIFVVEGVTLTITTAGGLGGTFTMSGGTYNGGTTACTILGDYTLSGGTYNATSSNTILDGTNFTYSGGDFNAGTGKVFFRILSGAASKTINNVDTFNQVEFRNQGGGVGKTFTISNAVSGIMVEGLLTISGFSTVSDDVSLNTGIIHAKDGITFAGQAITSTGGTATIILDGTADQTITTSTTADNTKNFPNVTINKASGTAILASGSRLNTTEDFTIQSGTFRDVDQLVDGDGGVTDNFTVQSGGTLEYSTATVSAPTGFNSIALNAGSTVSYTLDGPTGQTILDLDYSNLTLSAATTASAKTLPLASTVTVTGTLTINGFATLDLNTNAEDISIFTLDNNNTSDAISNTSNLITFTGSSAATIDDAATGTVTYGPVTFANTAGTSLNVIAGTIEFGNLTINGSRIFDPNAVDFNVAGNWTNNSGTGGFTPDATQQVTFTGDASRTVGGTGSTEFRDLTCNLGTTAARTLTFNTACNIVGVLDVEDGQIVTNGNITLISNASGTAAVAVLFDGVAPEPEATAISGNVTCQRFINENVSAKWHLLAAQTTGGTLSDWNDDIFYSGFSFIGADWVSGDFISVRTWDESTDHDVTTGFITATNVTNSLNNDGTGTGILQSGFYVYDQFVSSVVDITGPVRSTNSDVSFSLTFNVLDAFDGWHLLGNPHPSPVDWGNARKDGGSTTANISATARRMLASGSFGDLIATEADATDLIASGEAIWVTATAAATLVIQEADKAPTGSDSYNTKHAADPLIGFKVTLKQGTYEDAPVSFYFRDSYLDIPVTSGFDSLLDAEKLLTNIYGKENLAAVVGNRNVSSNFFPDAVSSLSIPLRFWKETPSNVTKTYTLQFDNIAAIYENNKCLTFEDTYAGISFPLTSDTTYTVSMNDTTYVPRFFIHISSPVTSSVTNIGCNGNTSGSVTATGSGSGPFNYTWKNQAGDTMRNVSSSTTDTLSNLTAGIYYLTVSNNGSCGTISTHFEITESQPITLSLNKTDVVCNGNSNGSAAIFVSGGNSPFAYLWNTGAITQNVASLFPGTYNVTVTDVNNCNTTASVSISEPPVLALNSSSTNISCNGSNDGSASITVNGGTSPYAYLWNSGGVTQNIASLSPGTYSVTVTDNNSCSSVTSVTISEPAIVSATGAASSASCGNSNGSAAVTATGGTGIHTYLWNTGAVTQSIASLSAGTFSVTVTDENGCSATVSVVVNNIDGPVTGIGSSTDVSCNGGSNGEASVSISGGTSPFTYLWSNGATQSQISNLTSQIYSVSVTDNIGCVGISSVTINEPSQVLITSSSTDATCGNSNGSASVTISGGTGIHSLVWVTGDSVSAINNIPAGNYSITVTDENNCTQTSNIIVNNIGGPAVNILSSTDVSCNGGSNGQVTTNSTGGTSPYSYSWSNGGTTSNISGLPAGAYDLSVTDANNCTEIISSVINQPDAIAITSSVTNALCGNSDGTATISVTGGTNGYSYSWSNGVSTPTINNLAAGSYFVLVTDANGCTKMATVQINNTNGPSVNLQAVDEPSCNGLSDGTATVTGSGNSPFTYLWQNSSGDTLQLSSANQGSDILQNISSGSYSVLVKDINGCGSTVSFTVNQPAQVISSFSINSDTIDMAAGGNINLTNTSSGADSYSWDFGDGSTSTQFEPSHSYSSVGTYTITLTAMQGGQCTQSFQQTVVVINSVGIIENSVSPEVVIFQAGKHAIVQYNFSMLTDMEIGLFNILGQHVIPLKSFPVLNGSIEIALPETTGIYFLKVKTENSERVIKMYR